MVYYVVQSCDVVRGDNVWVSFLGYPARRSCWRSASTHFRPEPTQEVQLRGRHTRVTVSMLDREPADGAIKGRVPVGLQLGSQPVAGLPKRPKLSRATRRQNNGEPRKKKPRGVYEVHVHKIRVGSDGAREVHEVRTLGKRTAASKASGAAEAASSQTADPAEMQTSCDAAARHTTESTHADGSGAGETRAGDECPANSNSSQVVRWDERSELWAEHRKLNSALWNRPLGSCFRIDVMEHNDLSVIS